MTAIITIAGDTMTLELDIRVLDVQINIKLD